jgi:hypothetical protein
MPHAGDGVIARSRLALGSPPQVLEHHFRGVDRETIYRDSLLE